MKTEEQRIAIAEACGWVWYRLPDRHNIEDRKYRFLGLPEIQKEPFQSAEWCVLADGTERLCTTEYMEKEFGLPDYLNDLNAMHEAEEVLCKMSDGEPIPDTLDRYEEILRKRFCGCCTLRATAAQRAEAFLRTLGLWKEE